GTTLEAGEHRLFDRGRVFLATQDATGAGAAESLVRGQRDDVGVRRRRRVRAPDDEAGDVRRVDQEQRAGLVGDLAEGGEVDDPRVRGRAGDDHLRALAHGEVANPVVVERLGLVVDAVGDEVVEPTAAVDRRAAR